MKPRELRVGNYIDFDVYQNDQVFDRYTGGRVTAIGEDHVYINGIKVPENSLYAVELTEERLLKFGFKIDNSFGKTTYQEYRFENSPTGDYLWISKNEKGSFYIFDGSSEGGYLKEVSYVHKLQNFIFEFMDEELTLKLNENPL